MDMLGFIRNLPADIEKALDIKLPQLPPRYIRHILWCGMGGSAIPGGIIKTLCHRKAIPFEVIRGYSLPPYIGENSLLFVVSYSGNTEEALYIYEDAKKNNANVIVVTSGGRLARLAEEDSIPVIKIPPGFPPRTAIAWLFVPPFRIVNRVAGFSISDEEIKKLSHFLLSLQKEFEDVNSIARELSEKFYLRLPVIYSSGSMFPVARRWKTQLNENAKTFAHIGALPEVNHNEITGFIEPEETLKHIWLVLLRDTEDHPRIKKRIEYTRELLQNMVLGINIIDSKGKSLLERIFYLIYMGDYISFFLSELYGVDPIKIPIIDRLKEMMSR